MAGLGGLGALLGLLTGNPYQTGVGGYGTAGSTATPTMGTNTSIGGLANLLGSGLISGSPGGTLSSGGNTIATTGQAGVGQGAFGTPYGYLGSIFGGSRNGGGNVAKSNFGAGAPHPTNRAGMQHGTLGGLGGGVSNPIMRAPGGPIAPVGGGVSNPITRGGGAPVS